MSDAEILLASFQSALPDMIQNWKRLEQKGYEARMAGRPRSYHGRRQRGCYFRGWDRADKELAEQAQHLDGTAASG